MNVVEGSRRMHRAGRAMVIVSASVFTLCAVIAGVYALLPSQFHVSEVFSIVLPVLLTAIWICAAAGALGTVLWLAGWILEGFTHHTQ